MVVVARMKFSLRLASLHHLEGFRGRVIRREGHGGEWGRNEGGREGKDREEMEEGRGMDKYEERKDKEGR